MTDFIVTVHALERMTERFPDVAGRKRGRKYDKERGEFIHAEVMKAIADGRQSKVAPRELAPRESTFWNPNRKGVTIVWTEDKGRGYVVEEKGSDMFVLTVLKGEDPLSEEPAPGEVEGGLL